MGTESKAAPALAVHKLSKCFGERVAFRDVSFEIGHGEIFGFLGPNGAGKTTTVGTLGTLIAPIVLVLLNIVSLRLAGPRS